MKALIWILCILANAFITTLMNGAGAGGAIPAIALFGFMLFVGRKLCKKWDKHIESKSIKKVDNEEKDVNSIVSQESKEISHDLETYNKRYCSKCGSIVDNESKKCTGCGKQYFNGFKGKNLIIITLLFMLI